MSGAFREEVSGAGVGEGERWDERGGAGGGRGMRRRMCVMMNKQ